MKKITFFLSLLFVLSSTAMAQKLVTDAASELTNGVKIVLQCRDTNGGPGWYFNANATKTAGLTQNNFFEVVGNATDGLKLKRVADGQYITRSGDNIGVGESDNGVTFTAISYKTGTSTFDFTDDVRNTQMSGTEFAYYVRFADSVNGKFLNTEAKGGTPFFKPGKGGYSAWYVYIYTDDEYSAFGQIKPSTSQTPEYLYTIMSGNNFYAQANTCPTQSNGNVGYFAFYAVEGVTDAYYIYSCSANQWLTYERADSYSPTKDFVNLSENKKEDAYFKLNKIVYNNSDVYEIQPYTSSGENNIYLNWYEGAGQNLDKRIGLWTDNGSSDAGSRWTLTPVWFKNDVKNLITIIKNRYPEKLTEVEDANVTWPGEYKTAGLNNFDFWNRVKNVENVNDLATLTDFKTKLTTYIDLGWQHGYPVNHDLTYPIREYGTAYFPFNIEKSDGLTLYTCSGVNNNELALETGNSFEANKAYIIQVTDENKHGKKHQFIGYGNQKSDTQANATSPLKGTHNNIPAPVGSYVLQTLNNNQAFYLVADGKQPTVTAGKCYLQLPESAPTVTCVVFPDGTTTGIENILGDAQTENAPVYDLTGRRVNHAVKGVYIIGGKKVIVK